MGGDLLIYINNLKFEINSSNNKYTEKLVMILLKMILYLIIGIN